VQRLDTPDGIAAVHSDHRRQFAIFTLEDGNRPTASNPRPDEELPGVAQWMSSLVDEYGWCSYAVCSCSTCA
jgi:hypothetical protein